jgi:hypothetical protein
MIDLDDTPIAQDTSVDRRPEDRIASHFSAVSQDNILRTVFTRIDQSDSEASGVSRASQDNRRKLIVDYEARCRVSFLYKACPSIT